MLVLVDAVRESLGLGERIECVIQLGVRHEINFAVKVRLVTHHELSAVVHAQRISNLAVWAVA